MSEQDASLEMIGLFDSEGHLTPSTLAALCCGSLCDEAALAVLTHIGDCAECAEDYAAVLEQGQLVDPPVGFTERLQGMFEAETLFPEAASTEQAEKPPVAMAAPEKKVKKQQSNTSFFAYAFRVAIAASIALVITFSGFSMGSTKKIVPVKAPGFSFVDSISNGLKDFSQSVLNREVFHHAETKK